MSNYAFYRVNFTISEPSLHLSYSVHSPPSTEPNAAVRGHVETISISSKAIHGGLRLSSMLCTVTT